MKVRHSFKHLEHLIKLEFIPMRIIAYVGNKRYGSKTFEKTIRNHRFIATI